MRGSQKKKTSVHTVIQNSQDSVRRVKVIPQCVNELAGQQQALLKGETTEAASKQTELTASCADIIAKMIEVGR